MPLAILLGSVLPALLLTEAVLADSLTLRIKERSLSFLEILNPSQTDLINPYYRPLFLILHGWFDRSLGLGDFGLRLLSSLCHVAAMAALARLGRTLGLSTPVCAIAVLLFGLLPGNVFTVAWPVVSYWTLAAALVFVAISCWISALRTGRKLPLIAGFVAAALSLLTSQTAYHLVALAPWIALTGPVLPGRGGRQRLLRAALLTIPMAALVAAHLLLLETGAQGLATSREPWELATRVLRTAIPYWTAAFGAEWISASPVFLSVIIGGTLLGTIGAGRPAWFLVGFTLLGPLPFAALGHSDRYAYFAAGPSTLWIVVAWWQGLPALAKRWAPALGPAVRGLGGAVLATGLVLATHAAWQRLEESRHAARITGSLAADLTLHRELLQDLDRVGFINLPPMMKWHVFDLLEVSSREELNARWRQFHNPSFFATDHAFFHFGSDPMDKYDVVLECDGERLHRRDPAHPMGERTPLSPPWFLAETYELIEFEAEATLFDRLDGMHERVRSLREPHRHVLVERPLEGLDQPLPTTGAEFRFELEPPPDEPAASGTGIRLPGRLVIDLDLPRKGLVVVITYFGAEDPVHRVDGDSNRFCRHIEALLDGKVVPVEPVFFHCSGVVVPPGPHQLIVRQRQGGPAPALESAGH